MRFDALLRVMPGAMENPKYPHPPANIAIAISVPTTICDKKSGAKSSENPVAPRIMGTPPRNTRPLVSSPRSIHSRAFATLEFGAGDRLVTIAFRSSAMRAPAKTT